MKNKIGILAMVLFSSNLFAAEPIHKGKSFTSNEDGVFLSLQEINELKEKVDLGEKNERLVAEYKKLVEEFKKLNAIDEKILQDYAALEQYRKQAIELYQESVEQYRKSATFMSEVNNTLSKKIDSQRRQSRWQKNLSFFMGFVTPLIGARAINLVK